MTARPDPLFALSLDRRFAVPPATVFRHWADAGLRQRWWGPAGFACPEFASDFRTGGAWSATITSASLGSFTMAGVYGEIRADRLICFSFRWTSSAQPHDTEVRVTLTPTQDGGTLQNFWHGAFQSAADRDDHAEGWGECLDRQVQELGGQP